LVGDSILQREESKLLVLATSCIAVTSKSKLNLERDYSHQLSLFSLTARMKKWGEKTNDAMQDDNFYWIVFQKAVYPMKKQEKKALWMRCVIVEK
jgi:hypothetical protein